MNTDIFKKLKYFECAVKSKIWERNIIYNSDSKIKDFIKQHNCKDVYRSVFNFNKDNPMDAILYGDFYMDFDSTEDISKTKEDILFVIKSLNKLEIREDDIKIFFSGNKGFHLIVPAELFEVKPSKNLSKVYKKLAYYFAEQLPNKTADLKIYERRRLLRISNTIHTESNLYKIPLTYEELKELSVEEIKKLARRPRNITISANLKKSEKASELYLLFREEIKNENKLGQITDKILMDSKINGHLPCIKQLFKDNIKEGERNNAVYILTNYLKNKGIKEQDILAQIEKWNKNNIPPLSFEELHNKVQYLLNKQYKIGCSNSLLEARCNKSKCPYFVKEIHLSDIQKDEYEKRQVKTVIIVVGIGGTYFVPKKFKAQCNNIECKYPCKNQNRDTIYLISKNDRQLMQFYNSSDNQLIGALRNKIGCHERRKGAKIRILEYQNLQELLVAPKATKITSIIEEGYKVIDELGREYKELRVFYAGALQKSNTYFEAIGYVMASPKNQIATMLIHTLNSLSEAYEDFQITDELKEKFKTIFSPLKSDIKHVIRKVKKITSDLTYNVTHIYGDHRERVLLAILLVFHSVLRFIFDGVRLKKGYLDIGIGGDTAQGKTQLWDRLSNYIEIGESISGLSTSRTGLTYAIENFGDRFFLKWGKYVLNDCKILFIDEAQAVEKAELRKMSQGRSEGLITVDRVVKGEHNSRTRLVFSFNPPTSKGMHEFMFGCQSIIGLFEIPDIRRFDLVIFVATNDISPDIIDIPREKREKVEQKITAEILRKHIFWAWTKKETDIIFDIGVIEAIILLSKKLKEKYGTATDIPLVSTEMKEKLARLCVALAALLHSTDEIHEKVIVKIEHVEYMEKFIQEIYNHDNCCLDSYAKIQKESSDLSDDEYTEIWDDINNIIDREQVEETTKEMLRAFMKTKDGIHRDELEAQLCIEKNAVNSRIKILKKHGLIKSTYKYGYMATPKFIKFLRRSESEEKLAEE